MLRVGNAVNDEQLVTWYLQLLLLIDFVLELKY